jgi:hypothetical protein
MLGDALVSLLLLLALAAGFSVSARIELFLSEPSMALCAVKLFLLLLLAAMCQEGTRL